jgi:hypothetical protein
VFVTGDTQSTNFPVTANALQAQNHGSGEAFVTLLSADFSRLLYSTYLGGPANDNGRSGFLGSDGSLYVTGSSDGPGWPTKNAYQDTFKGGPGDYGAGDNILAKLAPAGTITLDPSRTYQTITGWEVAAFALEPGNPAFPNFKDTLFDQAVNDVGINRVRLEVRSGIENTEDTWSDYLTGKIDYQTWRSRRYATVNDNADPQTINPAGFQFTQMDDTIDRIVNPLRRLLAAKGERLIVNVNYVAFTNQITTGVYIHNNPAEYAEYVLATYLHLKEKYGWVPDLWEVVLEPDNVSQWNGKLLGQALVAAADRLKQAGFEPAFVAPSSGRSPTIATAAFRSRTCRPLPPGRSSTTSTPPCSNGGAAAMATPRCTRTSRSATTPPGSKASSAAISTQPCRSTRSTRRTPRNHVS